jgi:hypothetical protein
MLAIDTNNNTPGSTAQNNCICPTNRSTTTMQTVTATMEARSGKTIKLPNSAPHTEKRQQPNADAVFELVITGGEPAVFSRHLFRATCSRPDRSLLRTAQVANRLRNQLQPTKPVTGWLKISDSSHTRNVPCR